MTQKVDRGARKICMEEEGKFWRFAVSITAEFLEM